MQEYLFRMEAIGATMGFFERVSSCEGQHEELTCTQAYS